MDLQNFYPRPLRGGRRMRSRSRSRQRYFYPRPLRGGRHLWYRVQEAMRIFLSTPSARRATAARLPRLAHSRYFYPRPLRGGRLYKIPALGPGSQFLSTPSARRATVAEGNLGNGASISIHALCEEGDKEFSHLIDGAIDISIHALCEEGDRNRRGQCLYSGDFYPRPLRGGRRTSGERIP